VLAEPDRRARDPDQPTGCDAQAPAGSNQHDGKAAGRDVLLRGEIAVGCDENLETVTGSPANQVAVRRALVTSGLCRHDVMAREQLGDCGRSVDVATAVNEPTPLGSISGG
jgi:hypothetical protein